MSQISVIVPVYKVEKYLERCIDSIFCQTFSDYDLILVDDGSPDRCPEMCDEIATADNRVVVIHQKNGGLSSARNTGIEWALENSDSEWITFIDSDDWVHPQYLESSLCCLNDFNLSISMCPFIVTSEYDDHFSTINDIAFASISTEEAFQRKELDPNSSCGRIFRKELFAEVRFPVGKLHEDRFTTYKLLFQFPSVAIINEPMYFYYVNPEGIVHSEWNLRKLDDLEATEQQLEFFKEKQLNKMYVYTVEDYIHLLVYSLKNMNGHSEYRIQKREIKEKLRVIIKKEKDVIGLSFKNDFNIYKYAYPFAAKIYRRLFMR